MHKTRTTLVAASLLALVATAAPAQGSSGGAPALAPAGAVVDRLPDALGDRQSALRRQALEAQVAGKIPRGAATAKVGKHLFVQLKREQTDHIFAILVQFGAGVGPLHNEIAQPAPDDNESNWVPNFSHNHYQQELFATSGRSLHTFYDEQSSGRYSVKGKTTDWVTVSEPESFYGNDDCGGTICTSVQWLVRDAVAAWTADRRAAGWSDARITAYLKTFDQQDRFDYNGNGDFNEPDGYIDHLIVIHAGTGEEVGGGAQGTDAIWSHSWAANQAGAGSEGPSWDPQGGYEFPGTGIWARNYTMEPEDGGLGVFAHEFGHDLGLPDEYDTSGGAEAPTGFWTLMSSGSYGNDGGPLENEPMHMDAWDKLQLGWLNYDLTHAGDARSVHHLGPVEGTTRRGAQALITVLPKRTYSITVNTPTSGVTEWYSGMGNDLSNTLTRTIDLSSATASAAIDLQAWYQAEEDYDYVYAEASTDGGSSWTQLDGTFKGAPIQSDGTRPALNGDSGGWGALHYDLSAYKGQSIQFRFRYLTDGGVAWAGFTADDIVITADGVPIFSDDVESGDNGWTAAGFTRFAGSTSGDYSNYYIAENRQYLGFDDSLRTGPYNFFDVAAHPNTVERFPYQNGLLIWYWNTFYSDNNVSQHVGEGQILPVDAHQQVLLRSNGTPWRSRVQAFDATFGLDATDPLTLTSFGVSQTIPSEPAVPTFDDTQSWWNPALPFVGLKLPATGTTISVISQNPLDRFMNVVVRPSS